MLHATDQHASHKSCIRHIAVLPAHAYQWPVMLSRIIATLLIICSGMAAAEQLTLHPNTDQPGIATAGIPFAPCVLTSADNILLTDAEGAAVPIFSKATLLWPAERCGAPSIRAVKLQFAFDPADGNSTYQWSFGTPSATRAEAPVCEVVRETIKAGQAEPCAYVISDPHYLVTTGIVPPTTAAGRNSYDTGYFPAMFSRFAESLDYATANFDVWLLDRPSTTYIQALRSGEMSYYREAYLSHEFFISKMEVTGSNTTVADYCLGGFDFGDKATTFGAGGGGCDTKYMATQAYKLHLALTGDDSWQPSENGVPAASMQTRDDAFMAVAATVWAKNGNQGGFSTPFTAYSQTFTERRAGTALGVMVNTYELTLDPAVLDNIKTAINNLHTMQNSEGYLAHSWDRHEGSFVPWIGTIAESVDASTRITVSNGIADGYRHISEPNAIRIGRTNVAVSGSAINNGATWTINLKTPVTVDAGSRVNATFAVAGVQGGRVLNWNLPADHGFSPWMQAILADAVWQYYWLAEGESKQQAADLLRGFGRATAAYAPDGVRLNRDTKTLIESAFNISIFDSGITAKHNCGLSVSPYPRYVANVDMGGPTMNRDYAVYMFGSGGFADQHTPEMLFQLALGIFFETDMNKKAAMQALANDTLDWLDTYDCTAGTLNYPARAYNWQGKVNPWGTYEWVMALDAGSGISRTAAPAVPVDVFPLNIAAAESP